MKTFITLVGGSICCLLANYACNDELPFVCIVSSVIAFFGVVLLVAMVRNHRPGRHAYEPFNRR